MGNDVQPPQDTSQEVFVLRLLEIAEDDVIGFNDVSGYYGPGGFIAWVLVIFTCYYYFLKRARGAARPPGIDFNMWCFLLPLNGSAADLLNRIRQINLLAAEPERAMQQAAPLAAATIFVTFGVLNCFALLIGEIATDSETEDFSNASKLIKRYGLLCVGMLLPSASMTVLLAYQLQKDSLVHEILRSTPAFYRSGMPVGIHDFLLYVMLLPGPMSLELAILLLTVITYATFPAIRRIMRWVLYGMAVLPIPVGLCALLFVDLPLRLLHIQAPYVSLICLAPYMALLAFLFAVSSLVVFIAMSAYYAVEFMMGHRTCFFMPCTPQKIYEMDQLRDLVIGCFALSFIELGLHRRVLKVGRLSLRWTTARRDSNPVLPV
ncbi:hypothetical protein CONLIGDRAFT_156808 [Coniochaeta ligniaria NRRL 30616]|uniref:Uncharacterized protein n=1 Tax=Coniochaeta ligniaria NRRL 30616 TaxID=1408157 RepID=A0A1J7J0M5_9PEZI|nr:hypothetical protein CONLIGDRAFT_156808 [Coniochaeta ligniaria NRRL 30616]